MLKMICGREREKGIPIRIQRVKILSFVVPVTKDTSERHVVIKSSQQGTKKWCLIISRKLSILSEMKACSLYFCRGRTQDSGPSYGEAEN